MICEPCANAADLVALETTPLIVETAMKLHEECRWPVSCTCQHRMRKSDE